MFFTLKIVCIAYKLNPYQFSDPLKDTKSGVGTSIVWRVCVSGIFNGIFWISARSAGFFFEMFDLFFEKSAAKRPNVFFVDLFFEFQLKALIIFLKKIYHILEVQNALKTKENDARGW